MYEFMYTCNVLITYINFIGHIHLYWEGFDTSVKECYRCLELLQLHISLCYKAVILVKWARDLNVISKIWKDIESSICKLRKNRHWFHVEPVAEVFKNE